MIFKTTDLGVAAYCKLNGLDLAEVRGREFHFSDPDGKARALAIAYANSECSRFDHEIRSLKKMTHL